MSDTPHRPPHGVEAVNGRVEPRRPDSVDDGGVSAAASTNGAGRMPLWLLPSWFTGADLRVLAKAPSDWVFYNALGLLVVLIACGNGFAMAVAVGYMLGEPVRNVWWVGVGWALVMACGVERVMLQLTVTRRRWLVLVLAPRIALSLLLAVQFGEPVMLRINQDAINAQMTNSQAAQAKAARTRASESFGPLIVADVNKINALRAKEAALRSGIEKYTFLSACEANTPSCSSTGRFGCGTYCEHYARLADQFRGRLAELKPEAQIATLQADIRRLARLEKSQVATGVKAIDQNTGLIAREEALSTIEQQHPTVAYEVWFWRFFFLTLDLAALMAKVWRVLIGSAYELLAAAGRRADRVEALRRDESSRVEEELIGEQGRADVEAGRIRIALENEHRIREEEAKFGAGASDGFTARPAANGKPLGAYSLTELVGDMHPHERERVAVDPRLARAGRLGTALMGAVALATWLISWLTNTSVAGTWVASGAFALAVGLGVFTKWYASAPRWALRPIFATLLVGLVMPIFVAAMNL